MDPTILEQLFSQGKISQQTYDMAKANSAGNVALGTAPANQPMMPASTPDATNDFMSAVPGNAMPPPSKPIAATPTPVAPVEQPQVPTVTPVTNTTIKTEMGSKETTNTSGKIKSVAEKQAEKDFGSSIQGQKDAAAGTADTATKKAAEQFNIEQERTKMLQEQTEKRQAAADAAQTEMDARLAKIDADVETLKNQKYEGYWSKKGTGEKIMGAIAIGLGAYGAAMGGSKQNYAMDIINKAMDDDFAHYKQGVDQQVSAISQSRLSLKSKEDLTKQKLDSLDAYKLGQIEVLKSKVDSLGSKFAGQDAQNKLAELNAQLDEKSATKRMEIEDKYAQSYSKQIEKEFAQTRVDEKGNIVSGPGAPGVTDQGKPMTEGQLKAQADLDKMNSSADLIDQYSKDVKDYGTFQDVVEDSKFWAGIKDVPVVGGLTSVFTDPMEKGLLKTLTAEERRYLNEVENFIAGKLRKESGSSISESEFQREYKRFFPVSGDTDVEREAKRKARNREIAARRTETGKFNQRVYGEDEQKK